jgi:branched-chain amino acid transport system ATP-binding protein
MSADQAIPILRMDGVRKTFAGFDAVRDLYLTVTPGTIHALIGPNGAGKTTVFNLATKFHQPSAGRIFFKGLDITDRTSSEIARLGMVRSFQISAVFASMTVLENVRVALQRFRNDHFAFWRSERKLHVLDARARELLDQVGLDGLREHKAGELPYGRRRALELATTLAADLSDHITVLARGEILAEGTYDAVSHDPAVVEAYMGSDHG